MLPTCCVNGLFVICPLSHHTDTLLACWRSSLPLPALGKRIMRRKYLHCISCRLSLQRKELHKVEVVTDFFWRHRRGGWWHPLRQQISPSAAVGNVSLRRNLLVVHQKKVSSQHCTQAFWTLVWCQDIEWFLPLHFISPGKLSCTN